LLHYETCEYIELFFVASTCIVGKGRVGQCLAYHEVPAHPDFLGGVGSKGGGGRGRGREKKKRLIPSSITYVRSMFDESPLNPGKFDT